MALQSITALATITLQQPSSIVTFSSIPNTYRDLILIVDHPSLGSLNEMVALFNSDTGANYFRVYMEGRASTGTAAQQQSKAYVGAYGTARATLIMQIFDYAQTNKQKIVLARGDSTDGTKATAVRWANTAAITSLTLSMDTINLPSGTILSLYGRIA